MTTIKSGAVTALLAAALASPAAATLVASDSVNFDGGRTRVGAEPVRAGTPADPRSARQIAQDEQFKADARVETAARPSAPVQEVSESRTSGAPGRKRLLNGALGAMCGLLGGGLLAYGVSRLTA